MADFGYTYKNTDDLIAHAKELGGDLPCSANVAALSRAVKIKDGPTLKNALAVHPMEGFDGREDGAPDELTFRRYERFASGGAALIWFEATAVQRDARTCSRQLWINRETLDEYKRMAEMIHEKSDGAKVIMQLTHSGRFSKPDNVPAPVIAYHNPVMNERFNIDPSHPVVTDDYLDRLGEQFLVAAKLAHEAGFDGVDIKACHRYLLSELLSAYTREGKYGGSYENRTRLMRDIVTAVSAEFSGKMMIGSRYSPYDGIEYPYGFGANHDDHTKVDLSESFTLLSELHALGLNIIDVTMGTPYFNPHVNRPYASGGYTPPEVPLTGVLRMITHTAELQRKFPEIAFIGTGYTYLRHLAPYVAAGAVESGMVSMVGFGRMAFAYPDFANDILAKGALEAKKCCLTCGKCTEIMRALGTTGCPIKDTEIYGAIYKERVTAQKK